MKVWDNIKDRIKSYIRDNNTEKVKSPNFYQWLRFIKDEIRSVEEEKKFLIGNLFAIFPTIGYLIFLTISSLDKIESYEKIDFDIKIIFLLWLLIVFFHIFRIILAWYITYYQIKILAILNISDEEIQHIISYTTTISFIVLLIFKIRELYPIPLVPQIPLYILDSWYYTILLILWGYYGSIGSIFLYLMEKLINKKIEGDTIEKQMKSFENFKKELYKRYPKKYIPADDWALVLNFIMNILIIPISIGWIILNLYTYYSNINDLGKFLKVQIEFNLLILMILFIYIFWLKPVCKRLINISKNKDKINKLMISVIENKLSPEDIEYLVKEYFTTRL